MSTHNIEISWFQKFAEANPFIKRFSFGDPSGIDLGKEGEYPIMHVQYNGTTYGEKSVSSAYAITLLDLPIDIDNKTINQREVISDMRQVAEDILSAIRNGDGGIFPTNVSFENPNITIFTEDYTNVLSGVQLDLNLTYPFLYNFCISPLGTGTETPNLPSTEYSTGRIRISQDATELGYARELNFDDTFEVSVVGNIAYITALGGGGGGGGSTWFDGAGVPSSGTGSNGDYYLNTTNGDVYRKTSGTWSVVGNIKGPQGNAGADGADGPAIELQVNATHIQWRVVGDATWINLIALSSITGADGREVELQVATNILQWRYVGDVAWTNLIDLSTLGFVPYTGANANLDMGTFNITADHIALNVNPSGAGYVVGSTRWNNTIGSSETLLKGGNVSLKNGVDLVARIVNKVTPNTTLTKAAYQAVRVSGATGGRLSVELAQANNDSNSADTIGLVTESIATNQEGFIIVVGQLSDINTTGSLQGETWADGDVLYLSPTTAGRITNIKPTGATGHIVVIGYVEYAHATQGSIYVKVMNGWELDELHNVNISSPSNNQVLRYNSTSQLWENGTLTAASITDSTDVGRRLVQLTNPSAITFLRINADNTVTALSASDFRTAIGAPSQDTLTWGNSPNTNIAAGVTTFGMVSSGGSIAPSTTESTRAIKLNFAYEVISLTVRLANAQPASGSLVATFRKGASVGTMADTAIVATVAANTQDAESTASPISGSDGDFVSVKFVNNASAVSGTLLTYYLELRRTS